MQDHVATAERRIAAPLEQVWGLLLAPESHSAMMFGARVDTDWREGSPITWQGEWEGTAFTDRGRIVAIEPPTRLAVTHFSPLSDAPEGPDSTHTIEWVLRPDSGGTRVTLRQDKNATLEAAEHSAGNWAASLDRLAAIAER